MIFKDFKKYHLLFLAILYVYDFNKDKKVLNLNNSPNLSSKNQILL